ncbi:WxL domain-containing protein [Enterococcus faecalis]|uniref:WxL domain-containing protein n=1 Tax=Enterococcus sp. DIV1375a TaxID=2774755 RepID=UPI001A03E7CA|nr:WxL domain-containing protein [Enterococcus faecalis]EGO9442838.1 WxL domain-containing protein [Enterococcus faecalis]EKJ5045474.1 WxL domain-containing protein [Enterococcus faecalis]EKL7552720.1 WxL domain-containing protein [Enterococcus faecalis]EKZ0097666.1 WxL domain-containing protein [Enterococcus faecalis]
MKRNKWQRLAAIGLCSSLLVNAFSGVTAVAETVTIESSPTAESSVKEETPASSVKEETTKASTENSQVTTDTSQEEETKEAEKQAETEVPTESSEAVQEHTPEDGRQNRWLPTGTNMYVGTTLKFIDESNMPFNEPLVISGNYIKYGRKDSNDFYTVGTGYKINSSNKSGGTYVISTSTPVPVPYTFTDLGNGVSNSGYALDNLSITTALKYVDRIEETSNVVKFVFYTTNPNTSDKGVWDTIILNPDRSREFIKQSDNSFRMVSTWGTTVATDLISSLLRMGIESDAGSKKLVLNNFSGTTDYSAVTKEYKVTRKQVTEKFVNTSGVAITPPTGFTQNKKTPMTSNNFTFKQAGTLPDTYTTGGKTYKFKGWYKGKTKPSTLTATKAPSYAVTYDGNDDLNVVYEETKEKTTTIPAVTYKFGFVDEKGALVAPTNFNMTTNLTTIMNGTPKQVGTASGVNNGNLKQLTIPSQQLTYTPSVNPAYSGSTNLRLIIPKRYKLPTVKPGTYYTGSSTAYPIATTRMRYVGGVLPDDRLVTDGSDYTLATTTTAHSYRIRQLFWESDTTKTVFDLILSTANATGNAPAYYTTDETMYYFLENRRVTENFVDTSGAKITAPTGFTQGKKTVITSDAYTFKQAGTLPDTYTTGGKTYKFKGWYKGKSILNTLTTTKAPSYQVTYDDNDDLNVVYEEETVTTFYPSINLNFVNEKGGAFTPALTFSGKYNVQRASDNVITNLYDVTSKSKGNGQYTVSVNNGSIPLSQELFKKYTNGNPPIGSNALSFKLDKLAIDQQLKYVDSIQVEAVQSSGLNVYRYEYALGSSTIIDSSVAPMASNLPTADINGLSFNKNGTNFSNTTYRFLGMSIGSSMSSTGKYLFHTNLFSNNPTNDAKLVYKVTRKQVTENFVDANGAKITAPTGFTQGNQVPMNSNTFKYTAAKALPATYTTGGKTYTFQGWYKGKTKPSTLNKTTTPTFNATFDGNDDMTAMYKEEIPTASVTLTRPKEVIDTNTNVIWTTTITNTSKAPLQNLTLKKGPNWSAGLTIPTFMEVTPEGETTKSIPVNSTLWTDGVSLPNAVPIGKKVSVAFTTRATGRPNTVLKAEVVVFGGIKDRTVDNFVRIRPNDQEVVTPTTEGFISVPTFDFGQVGVAGTKQQHSLKKAADYYGNGTRNPYVRIKKTQPSWSLTAQLSQPKSATDSLPTATRLLLGAAPVSSFTNYNQPTELKNAVGTTSAISLTANNTATSIIANKQFTGSNVYQLDFTFNNVKLEVPANQGVKGQQYKAAVTWNLVTGP